MSESVNQALLIKVIGKKLFSSTWHDYAHPYLASLLLGGIFIMLIADALITYFWIKNTKRFPFLKNIILVVGNVLVIILLGVVGNNMPGIGGTSYQGYIKYLNTRTHGMGAEAARELWNAHVNSHQFIDPNQ
ncbi:hypothetical protein EFN46_07795 [Leuconostoc pseudomesenteroides]|uniref:hypothetical protein n=1 Tax=Leuconostoc pseudomesenteroides TaxID=33968 RepID=UPI0021A9B068|nr:hypothetical protein [Leuconostoc pseudomesenteroides]MCT4388114.1 hypothetical protein [Leuconostoc pseudomesenteroides]